MFVEVGVLSDALSTVLCLKGPLLVSRHNRVVSLHQERSDVNLVVHVNEILVQVDFLSRLPEVSDMSEQRL